ncbi:MAG: small multi-drug export protein [Oscillospiraceae bacterium]|jgi:uncharacterized membrane protein|nr:small multi-drug export protein [Oscillospiraceae bacterium]
MVKNLITCFQSSFSPVLIVFLISILPVTELRGSLIAASLLHVDWRIALLVSVVGNMLPVPFILLFIKKILEYLKETKFKKIVEKLEFKADKNIEKVLKYKHWGLALFVAIPLPGTGTWTGALVAALLNIKIKEAIFFIALGSLTAGILVLMLSYGIMGMVY